MVDRVRGAEESPSGAGFGSDRRGSEFGGDAYSRVKVQRRNIRENIFQKRNIREKSSQFHAGSPMVGSQFGQLGLGLDRLEQNHRSKYLNGIFL